MKNHFLIGIYLVLSTFTVSAHRENVYFLSGKVGASQIGLRIDEVENTCFAQYFVVGNVTESTINGQIDEDQNFIFYKPGTSAEPQDKRQIVLNIRENEQHVWTGHWVDSLKGVIPVVFKPIVVDSLNHPNINAIKKYKIDGYFALRTAQIAYQPVSKEKMKGGISILWLKDNLVGLKYFRLIPSKRSPHMFETANTLLESQHLRKIEECLQCRHQAHLAPFELSTKVHYIKDKHLSYSTITTSNCYNIIPTTQKKHENIDIHTAQPLELEDLFYVGEKPTTPYVTGSAEWYQYRYNIFAPTILELFKRLYPTQMSPTFSTSCNYSSVQWWQFPTWHLTTNGLYLGSNSMLSSYLCDEPDWSIIPWHELTPYWQTTDLPNKK